MKNCRFCSKFCLEFCIYLERHWSSTLFRFFKKGLSRELDEQTDRAWICDLKGRKTKTDTVLSCWQLFFWFKPILFDTARKFHFFWLPADGLFCPYRKYRPVNSEGCRFRDLSASDFSSQCMNILQTAWFRTETEKSNDSQSSVFQNLFFAWAWKWQRTKNEAILKTWDFWKKVDHIQPERKPETKGPVSCQIVFWQIRRFKINPPTIDFKSSFYPTTPARKQGEIWSLYSEIGQSVFLLMTAIRLKTFQRSSCCIQE